jgi:hypothetical protein
MQSLFCQIIYTVGKLCETHLVRLCMEPQEQTFKENSIPHELEHQIQ